MVLVWLYVDTCFLVRGKQQFGDQKCFGKVPAVLYLVLRGEESPSSGVEKALRWMLCVIVIQLISIASGSCPVIEVRSLSEGGG